MREPVRAFIGIGSNLGDPRAQIEKAFAALAGIAQTRLIAKSALYRSRPLGWTPGLSEFQDQPDYLNAVAELETALAPEALLDALLAIEAAQGRVRETKWGPRTLDLDLLLYGDEKISAPRLTVPHPGLPERHFVLYPLADLAPDLHVPGLGRIADLAAGIGGDGIERLD